MTSVSLSKVRRTFLHVCASFEWLRVYRDTVTPGPPPPRRGQIDAHVTADRAKQLELVANFTPQLNFIGHREINCHITGSI
jgi:hypothetical protein